MLPPDRVIHGRSFSETSRKTYGEMRKRRMPAASSLAVGGKWKKPLGEADPAALRVVECRSRLSYVPFANPVSTKSALSEFPAASTSSWTCGRCVPT